MQIRHIKIENYHGIKELDWHIPGGLVCIIGRGDSCKTTLLDAIEVGLSPNPTVAVDDSDFFGMDVTEKISIQITIGGFGESKDLDRVLLSETNYGLYVRGYKDGVIVEEPVEGAEKVLTIEFSVDDELEPQWQVLAPGRHEPKRIHKSHLEKLGTVKLGTYSDWHFSWSKNSMLSRLLKNDLSEINRALASVGRKAREQELELDAFEEQAEALEKIVQEFGVNTAGYGPKLDIQALTIKSGGLSLHDDGVPIKRYGVGTKRLIALAIQKKLHEGKNIRLIDEIEYGLEPYRISQAMAKIHSAGGQTFITTHSPTVVREATIDNLVVFHRDGGKVEAVSLAEGLDEDSKSAIQGTLRGYTDAFLSSKIIVCEGATEWGIMRAFDRYRQNAGKPAFSARGVAVLDAGGVKKCAPIAERLKRAGYNVAIFCDADDALTTDDVALNAAGIAVKKWDNGRFTEQAIFEDLSKELLIDAVRQAIRNKNGDDVRSGIMGEGTGVLDDEVANWSWDDADFRTKVSKAASKGQWFKSTYYGIELGKLLFTRIDTEDSTKNFCKVVAQLGKWCD